ncbi:MAG: choice-of-anchor Q domain-containing protein [Anaerolineales bacterium]
MTHNVAVGGGGGMYVKGTLANNGAWASLMYNRILSNTARGIDGDNTHGGGIYLGALATTGSTVYFSHNTLQGNQAGDNFGGSGGGARLGDILGSDVEIRENWIMNNTATDSGGGFYIGQVNKGTLDFSGNEISQNTVYSNALKYGGGFYLDQMKMGAIVTMTGNSLMGNRATGNGGGCYIKGDVDEGVTYIFRQNHVDHNISEQDGGGCYFVETDDRNDISSSMLKFIDNTFNYNTSAGNYSGVFLADLKNSHLRFWGNQLIGNRAGISGTVETGGDGGGIYFTAIDLGSVVDFRDNEVISNTAYISPTGELGAYGGLYAYVSNGSVLAIQGSRFDYNEAESDYAGVYVELINNARLMMARTVITGNTAAYKNGGVSIISLENKDSGFSQYFLERNKIINNISNSLCGLSIIDEVDDAPPLWGRSTNNVIAGNDCGGVHLENVDFRSTNDTIADNVGAGFSVAGTLTSTIYLNNSILWGNTMNLTTTEPLTQSRFVEVSSYKGTADIFVDADGRNYHLKPGASAVINKANDDLAPAVDHDGVPRPVGSKADIGAYEYRVPGVTVAGDELLTGMCGEIVTHTATITNDGTAQDGFDLALDANTWPATLSTAEVTLGADESITIYVWVEVPLGLSQWVTDTTRVIATSQRNAAIVDAADLETQVGLAPAVSLTPDNSAVAPDNSSQRYQHVLVNAGNGSDTFLLSASSSQGWMTQVDSNSVTLGEGLSETIEVSVWVPKGADGLVDTTIVTATSVSNGSVFATARNRTTIAGEGAPAVLSLTPDRAANVVADRHHVYTHTLTNLATQPDTFTLTVASDTGWPVALSAVTRTLDAGASATVSVTVTAPVDSAHQQVDVTTLTATSHRDNRATDSVSDRTTALRPSDLALSTLSPEHVTVDTAIEYVHRLTNYSHLIDTVALTVTSSQGWPVTVSPSTMILAGGAQGEVTVTVSVPLTSAHGDADQTRLTAISGNDGKQVSVSDMTTARKPSDLKLSPDRTGVAIVGADQIYTHTLENNSVYTDVVLLAATAPDSNWGVRYPVSMTLGAGMSTTVMVTVSVPMDAQTGENFLITLSAISSNDGQVVSVVDLTTAQRPSDLSLTSNNPTSVLAGQQRVYYQHILTNESASTDTVTLDATSSQGWSVDIGPRTVTLGPGMDATVAVTLTLPADDSNGTMDITTVEARSDNAGGALAAAASDVTTLLNPASIQLQASQAVSTEAGSTVLYEHSLVNAGDYQDIFSLEAVSDQGWQINLSQNQARLSPGEGVSITLQVTVPATATAGSVDRTTLSAISTYDREREASVTNVDATHVTGGKIYLPLVLRNP